MRERENNTRSGAWKNIPEKDWYDWRWQFANRVTGISQLQKIVTESPETLEACRKVMEIYPFSVTPYYFSLINVAECNDPLRVQCFPDIKEIDFTIGGIADPLMEERDMPVPGLIHRYPDRCVALVTSVCAMYCRHCNRKRLWRKNQPAIRSRDYLRCMIDYVSGEPLLREVIISGGDPLIMTEEGLDWFLGELRSIPHVEVLRIGSRIPVVMPMRITRELCAILRNHRPLWLNTQFNHPNEITKDSAEACEMLLEAGIPVSNQSVLLRGVNDTYEVMCALLYGLQRISVRPYYLFQCEPVEGTDHFRTDIQTGIKIMKSLWEKVSGLCVPRYVLDIPGGKGKIPLFPSSFASVRETGVDSYCFDRTNQMI